MVSSAPQPFTPPAIPWLEARPLVASDQLDPGPGVDPALLHSAMERVLAVGGVQALVLFGSRARGEAGVDSDLDLAVILTEAQLAPEQKLETWRCCRQAIGPLGAGLDLVVVGSADAERLSGSRWHVLGDVAREGRVIFSAGG
jgi:predicted nucleotidyltransferase